MKAKEIVLAMGVLSVSAALIGLGSYHAEARPGGSPTAAKSAPLVDGRIALSAMIALVDGRLTSVANTLTVIASTSEAQSGNWERVKPLLSRLREEYPQSTAIFALPDGSYYDVATGRRPIKVNDRHYFREAMAGRRTIGELLTDRVTGENSVIVDVPVKAGTKIVGLVGAALFLKPLNTWLMQAMRLPKNMVAGAIDAQGRYVLSQDPGLIFRDVRTLGSPSLVRAFREAQTGREGTATYEVNGKQRTIVYATSPLTGWHYALGVTK